MGGEPKNAEEAAARLSELMAEENEILGNNTELWEKVFKEADKGMAMIEDGKNYGEFLLDTIEAAKEHNADIIGLSALMTTTMMEMKKVVNLVKENNMDTLVIIGGAVITLGSVNMYYRNLKDKGLKKQIAKRFCLHAPVFESWLSVLTLTRNACCHHARVWNKVNKIIPNDMRGMTRPWITIPADKRRIYYNMCIIKYFLDIISPNNDMLDKMHNLFSKFPEIDLAALGFPVGWEQEPLWIQANN